MTRTLRAATVSIVIAVLAVSLLAFTVSAHATAPSYSSQAAAALPAVSCAGVPATKIVTSKKLAVYNPTKLAVKVSTTVSFCITNKTKAAQGVVIQGQTLVTIAVGKTAAILCNRPNTGHFTLKSNPKAKLTVTCTA